MQKDMVAPQIKKAEPKREGFLDLTAANDKEVELTEVPEQVVVEGEAVDEEIE